MEAGLTTDVAAEPKADDAGSADKVIAAAPAPPSAGGKGGGVEFVVKGEAKPGPKVVECLDEALQSTRGHAFVNALRADNQPVRICGEVAAGPQKNVVFWRDNNGKPEAQQIEIVFRSTYEIFRYLGALMNEPAASGAGDCANASIHAAPTICDFTTPDAPTPIGPLFKVQPGAPLEACFTAVAYATRRYCVPNGGRELDMTKDVFNILISLIALKQSPGDLPTPQAVLLQ
jgi:hypothetical protein